MKSVKGKKIFAAIAACIMLACVAAGCKTPTPAGAVEDPKGLEGRVVYSIGKGNVPDLVFRYLLSKAGVKYRVNYDEAQDGVVSLSYVSEGTEIIGGLGTGTMSYGVISEPAATVALGKVQKAKRMLDIQKVYAELTKTTGGYPQAALVVKKTFLDSHNDYVADFAATFAGSAKWAETQPSEALAAIKTAGSTTVPKLTAEIAKGCNLGFKNAASVKSQLLGFYEGMNGVAQPDETKPVPKMPDDAFFVGEIEKNGTGATAEGVKVFAPDGAPAISLSKMINDGFAGASFGIVPPEQIGGKVLGGDADIAIMPTNAAAKLYGAGADIVMLGVTNFGSLYLIGLTE